MVSKLYLILNFGTNNTQKYVHLCKKKTARKTDLATTLTYRAYAGGMVIVEITRFLILNIT